MWRALPLLLLLVGSDNVRGQPSVIPLTAGVPRPFYFTLPAARGHILDVNGNALARTAVLYRLTLRVPRLEPESEASFIAWIQRCWPAVERAHSAAAKPDEASLKQHFRLRRRLPIPVSEVVRSAAAPDASGFPEFLEMQTQYIREYPNGTLASHVLGYASSAEVPSRGPLRHGERMWREFTGRLGIESSMNLHLTGQPGLLAVCYDKEGRVVRRNVLKRPIPGHDVVTTIHREIQAAAEKTLAAAARAGALVVLDAGTGDLLAMASAPSFDPASLAMETGSKVFAELTADADRPLVNRAIGAAYPPGSLFKIVVALAGLQAGQLHPRTTLPCGPEVTIDGILFRNWSDIDRGWFDLNAAIVRSCNTYFYHAAIALGDRPILDAARAFGFGVPVDLPLPGNITGSLPASVPSAGGQANLAIGQSPVLTTPLEAALAMAALADGALRPRPRLVALVRDEEGRDVFTSAPGHEAPLSFAPEHMSFIHQTMYSVANHIDGTGIRARVDNIRVHGKTGTSQWARDGALVTAVWFAGFVKDFEPPLAFAVVLEGNKRDYISGGNTAAPVIGRLLFKIAANPETYGIRTREVAAPRQAYSLGNIYSEALPGIPPRPEIGPGITAPAASEPAVGLTDLGR